MTDYIASLKPEGKRGPRDWPATLGEAAAVAEHTAMPLVHKGRPFETIGQTLARMTGEAPDPLPPAFIEGLAALVANPETAATIGRILLHCLTAAREAVANV